MKCEKCSDKGNVKSTYTDRRYCDKHFMEMISKRIRKNMRTSKEIDVKREYSLVRTTPHETMIAKHFLKEIFNGRLKTKETSNPTKSTPLIVPRSLDKEAKEFLEEFLENKKGRQTQINPLRVVLEEEIKEISKILGIKYSENKETNKILETMEAEYPGTKFSLMKSMEEIRKKQK